MIRQLDATGGSSTLLRTIDVTVFEAMIVLHGLVAHAPDLTSVPKSRASGSHLEDRVRPAEPGPVPLSSAFSNELSGEI